MGSDGDDSNRGKWGERAKKVRLIQDFFLYGFFWGGGDIEVLLSTWKYILYCLCVFIGPRSF